MAAELDVDRFLRRLSKLHSHFLKHNSSVWNSADVLVINRGKDSEDEGYVKSSLLHLWLFGYDLLDTILLLRKDGSVWFLAAKKKIEFVQPAASKLPAGGIKAIHTLLRNKADNAENYQKLWEEAGITANSETKRLIGMLVKETEENQQSAVIGPWEAKLSEAAANGGTIEKVDVSAGIGFCMSVKDDSELDLMRKSSVLANKVMKHGCVKKMEEVIDSDDGNTTNESLATYVEEILADPSKISLKVPGDDVRSVYHPIVQSGGKYDLKLSAETTDDRLSHDVILVQFGARYKTYCSNIARTFFVDPPKKMSDTYEILLEVHDACLTAMKPGNQLKQVYGAAVKLLQNRGGGAESLVQHLPKNLGFCTGLEFRESALMLNAKNTAAFRQGMVFCLSVGLQNLELSPEDKTRTPDKSPIKKLSTYSLLISDMVAVTADAPDVLTKLGKNLTDIAYNINEDDQEDGEDDDDDDDDDEDDDDEDEGSDVDADEKYARKVQASENKRGTGVRTSSRLAKEQAAQQDARDGVAERELKQIRLMERRNEERLRELSRKNRNKDEGDEKDQAEELEAYKKTRDYPENVQPNQVRVDMAAQCVLLPICGIPVPFHISTIKNVVMPDADNATLLRINFFTPGVALGKDAPANMVKLVQKYAPYASFIREMTFRSLDGQNLTQAFRQLSELKKRVRQKEIREQEEADLVVQEKLVRTKNERVPRLADLTMRPVITGRKTQGNLEAHTNGLRFISTTNEVVDIMYANIKYAIYQPCENEIMVLIHFHLKNPIMIGKKKHSDVQFYTEVIEASQAVDNSRRSMYDPDEMDDEQRERQLRKRLNQAFKEFCKKVDVVAKKNGYSAFEFEIPYRDLGFTGTPNKEMVTIMPTLNCLVSLTESPFFVVDLEEVDHVHFERVTYMSKAFDMVLINKDFNKQPWRVDMIPNSDKDGLQEWLTDMEITYTEGPMNLNWKQIISTIKDDDRFYMDTEEDEVTKKEAGWEFLRLFGNDDEDDLDNDEDDSEFDEDKNAGSGGDEESSEDAEEFDSEEDEDEDFDADEDLEEEGLDWDEMEEEAAASDRKRSRRDEEEDEERRPRKRNSAPPRRR